MGYYKQKAGTTEIIKEASLFTIYKTETKSGRPELVIEFVKDGDVITQIFLLDNILGLKEACDFIRSIPIPETQVTHIYKNETQFKEFIKYIRSLFRQNLGDCRTTREGTAHGYDLFDLEVTVSPSGWQTIKILDVIKKVY